LRQPGGGRNDTIEVINCIPRPPDALSLRVQFDLHDIWHPLPLPGWQQFVANRPQCGASPSNVFIVLDVGNDRQHEEVFVWFPGDRPTLAGWPPQRRPLHTP